MPKIEMILKSLEATGDPSMVDWIGPLLQFFSTHYLLAIHHQKSAYY
jgi:hypothetical protein